MARPKKQAVSVSLPKGYTAIRGGGDFAPTFDAERDKVLEGIMAGVHQYHQPKKGKIPARDVNIYTIKTKEGEFSVWESAGLRALARIKKGKPVYIRYLGKKKIPGQTQPMRDYIVATKG